MQRRVAAAEVVHQNLEARLAELLGGGDELGRVVHIGGLGDFQPQHGGRQIVFLQEALQIAGEVGLEQVHPRDVDRDGQRREAAGPPIREIAAGQFPHIMVEIRDETVVLEQRDEPARLDDAFFRVVPAHQRFGADRLFEVQAVDRLQVQYESAGIEGLLHIVQDFLLGDDGRPHRLVVVRVPFVVIALDRGARQIRAVAHGLDFRLRVGDGVDAVMDDEIVGEAEVVGQETLALQYRFEVEVLFLHADGEHVRAETAADALAEDFAGRGSGELDEDAVAHARAVDVVDDLETVDVQRGEHELVLRVLVDEAARRVEECAPVGDARQTVQPLAGQLRRVAPVRFQFLRVGNQADERTLVRLLDEMRAEAGKGQGLAILPPDMEIERHRRLFLGDHAGGHTETVEMVACDGGRKVGARLDERRVFLRRVAAKRRVRRREIERRKGSVVLRFQDEDAAVDSLAARKNERVKAAGHDFRLLALQIQHFFRHLEQQRHTVRLVREPRRAEAHSFFVHVVLRRRGQQDDRQVAESRREPEPHQKLQPVHARHQDIEKDQRRVRVPLQEGEGFHAVRRLVNVLVIGECLPNQGTARVVVVHDQDFLFFIVHVSTSSCLAPPHFGGRRCH